MFGPDIDLEFDDAAALIPPPLDSRRPSICLYKEQGSQEDIIPIMTTDNSYVMTSTGGLEDLELNQASKAKGKFKVPLKVEEIKDHIILCFLDYFFPDGISTFMVGKHI
jgi:hypothetical protein